MYIAVTADGPSMESSVSGEFEDCAYLLIVNTGDMTVKEMKNGAGLNLDAVSFNNWRMLA